MKALFLFHWGFFLERMNVWLFLAFLCGSFLFFSYFSCWWWWYVNIIQSCIASAYYIQLRASWDFIISGFVWRYDIGFQSKLHRCHWAWFAKMSSWDTTTKSLFDFDDYIKKIKLNDNIRDMQNSILIFSFYILKWKIIFTCISIFINKNM